MFLNTLLLTSPKRTLRLHSSSFFILTCPSALNCIALNSIDSKLIRMNFKAAAIFYLCTLQVTDAFFVPPPHTHTAAPASQCHSRNAPCMLMSAVDNLTNAKQKSYRTNSRRQSHSHILLLNDLSNQKTRESAQKAEDTLFLLEADENESEQLNVVHYASVINSWANIGDSERAHALLERMIGYSKRTNILPNSHCFSGVMKAFINAYALGNGNVKVNGKKNDANSGEESETSLSAVCHGLLTKMNNLYVETAKDAFKPNTVVYNTLLNAYADEVTSLFLKRKMNKREKIYSNILQRHPNVKNDDLHSQYWKGLVTKAVGIVDEMEKSDGSSVIPIPDVYTYCTVISLLAKCEDMESAAKAESYLPCVATAKEFDTPTYNAVISAWASTGTIEGAKRATTLLLELEKSIEHVPDPLQVNVNVPVEQLPSNYGPNSVSYFTVISAWVKSCKVGDGGHAAEMAETILGRMVAKLKSSSFKGKERLHRFQPNVIAYSSIIDCWSKSGATGAPDRAKRLLESMKDTKVTPNVYTYTSALTTFARSKTREGALEASKLLDEMKKYFHEAGDEDLKPSVISYFAVIDAWARSDANDAGFRSEQVLNEMEELYRAGDYSMKPDVRVYARVISAYAKSTEKGSDYSANTLIKRMERFALTGDEKFALAKPNVVCYNTMISSFARRGDPLKAFEVLNKMDQYNSRVDEDNDRVIADQHSLDSIIFALSRSNLKGKAKKALKMLERLENSHVDGDWMYGEPCTKSYNLVISTCSNSFKASEKEKAQALSIAMNAYGRLRTSKRVEVDRYTYILLLKACGKLLPSTGQKRRKLVESVFTDCCSEGCVDDSVLSNFLIAAPKDLAIALLGEELLKYPKANKLPEEWTYRISTM